MIVKHTDIHRTELISRQLITLTKSIFSCTESKNESTEYFEAGVQRPFSIAIARERRSDLYALR